jgi:hypothetical protein
MPFAGWWGGPVSGCSEVRYFGVDPFGAVEAGDAYPVMAVLHEVELTQLVEGHRRQLIPEPEGTVYAFPALAGEGTQWHEALVEVVVLSRATDDARYIYRDPATIDAAISPQ